MLSRIKPWLIGALLLAGGLLAAWWMRQANIVAPIRIGVVFAQTGTMAASGQTQVDAVRLAVEDINAAGGLLGRPVEMVLADGRSDPRVFATEVARLIEQEHVSALFACWTSACRKAVKPVVERNHHLLFYSIQYEGLEQSPNIVYTGATPNQQIIPGTRWMLDHHGKRVFLIGSDYVFPHAANRIIRDMVDVAGGTVLTERYLTLGSRDVDSVVAEIRRLKPDAILNTVNGDSNRYLFQALAKAGLQALPIMSFSVAEEEMAAYQGTLLTEHYACWSYFQSLPGEAIRNFVAAFRHRFGPNRVTSDPVVSTYEAVRLWAQAVASAGVDTPTQVGLAVLQQSLVSPAGIVSVDHSTRHVWKTARIGKIGRDGQFQVTWSGKAPLRPSPYPFYRFKSEWDVLIDQAGEASQ